MIHSNETVTIFGGNGFIGQYLVRHVAKTNARILVISNTTPIHNSLSLNGFPGQIFCIKSEKSKDFYENIISQSDYVVNLIGILSESNHNSFKEAHEEIPNHISFFSEKHKIKKLIQISALGIQNSNKFSQYAKSKINGENIVLKNYKQATIMRPSVVFGREDKFINLFASILKIAPIFPLIMGGKTLFQPIYVNDLAKIISYALHEQSSKYLGKIFEIGGNRIFSMHTILETIKKVISSRCLLIPTPYIIMKAATHIMQTFGSDIMTPDQLELLKFNSVVENNSIISETIRDFVSLEHYLSTQI